jgi:tRNA 2-thiocytidine biosynthesis protein TtcA
MIKEGDRILVALSGGKDSLTLLHALNELKKTLHIKFEIGACISNFNFLGTVDPQVYNFIYF